MNGINSPNMIPDSCKDNQIHCCIMVPMSPTSKQSIRIQRIIQIEHTNPNPSDFQSVNSDDEAGTVRAMLILSMMESWETVCAVAVVAFRLLSSVVDVGVAEVAAAVLVAASLFLLS